MFKKEFKNAFMKLLKPYGYVYCSKLNYFVKVLNSELLFFIGYWFQPSGDPGYRCFTIVCGCTSLYFTSLEKDGIEMCECRLHEFDIMNEHGDRYDLQYDFLFRIDDKEEMKNLIAESFVSLKTVALPVLGKIVDLKSYIEYKKKYDIGTIRLCERFLFDSLVLIKADNHDDFLDVYNAAVDRLKELYDKGIAGGDFEEEKSKTYRGVVERIAGSRDKVYADPELYKKALEEADRRKKANTELLRSYGIDI